LLSGGTYYANLQQLGGTAPFAPLRQNVGAVDITSDVTLTFTRNTLSGTSSLGSAIYDLALAPYSAALAFTNISSISGVSTVSYTTFLERIKRGWYFRSFHHEFGNDVFVERGCVWGMEQRGRGMDGQVRQHGGNLQQRQAGGGTVHQCGGGDQCYCGD